MKLPMKTSAPVIGVLTGLAGLGIGFGLGMLVRQPEINALQKQVMKLQKEVADLRRTVKEQNDELTELILMFHSLKAWQLVQKRALKTDIKGALTLQYGLHDYFSLMLDRLETGRDFEDEETAFYSAFSRKLDGKRLSEEQEESISSYVLRKHAQEIKTMRQCDVSRDVDLIEAYDSGEREAKKRTFNPLGFWKHKSDASEADAAAY